LPLLYIGRVLSPARLVLGQITSAVLRLLGQRDVPGWGTVTEAEIAAMMSAGQAAGVTSAHERELVDHILKLGTIEAHDLMIPRTEILGVRDDTSLADAYLKACRLRHARIPVYHEDMDDLWGMISVVDMPRWRDAEEMGLPLASFRGRCEDPGNTDPVPVYPVYVVPEAAKVEALINSMRERRAHMAVVVGEYGGTAGILTLEDILEEVVGQISPSEGEENSDFVKVDDTVFADGGTHLRTLNEELALGLEQNGADTLGGFVMEHLGRLPRAGDTFENAQSRFTVIKMAGRRIGAVRIDPLPALQEEETD
jgi:putative hemolysin